MSDGIQQVAASAGAGFALFAGTVCDPVYLNEITLNDVSLAAGIGAGVLTMLLQAIKIYRALRGKGGDT